MQPDARFRSILAVAVLAILGGRALADQKPAADSAGKAALATPSSTAGEPAEHLSVTQHSITIDGRKLKYTATAGRMLVQDDSEKPQAWMFFVAYTLEGADPARRPVAFAFNGGPGASSVYLQVGGIGPKRCPLASQGTALPEAYKLVDNSNTWLKFTDLVFIDPVGTGYSRAAAGVDAKSFYDMRADIQTAARFIRLYVTRNGRWLSPKYLIGESYGATRAAGLVDYLQKEVGMNFAGLVLISAAIDFQTFSFSEGNDLPYALSVPSYAATAWYHGKLAGNLKQDLEKTLAEAHQWALNGYLVSLAAGSGLSDESREQVADRLAGYTGLSRRVVKENGLRISNQRFAKELLRDRNRRLGILDGRVTAAEGLAPTQATHSDPALYLVTGPWVAVLNDYVRRELKYDTDLPYVFLSREANQSWQWDCGSAECVNVSDDLAEAMTLNEHLRVFGAAGCYDLTTPYAGQQYTYDHLPIAPSLRKNLTFSVYRSGHQIYVSDKPLEELTHDVGAFFETAGAAAEKKTAG